MSQFSHVIAEDPAVDLAIAEAMAAELEAYVVNDELYRTVIATTARGDERLKMTGGDLLARLHRLQGERAQLSPDQLARLDRVQSSVDETIHSLRTRFHERLEREVGARVDALKWYLDDLAGDVERGRANFPYEMRNRQRIEVIRAEIQEGLSEDLVSRITSVDRRIRQVTRGSDFIWDERFRELYPASTNWFLYVTP